MTVRELKDLCDQCIKEHGEDCQVVVMDTSSDDMSSYSITEGQGNMIPREVTPTKMKTLKVQWKPNSGIKSHPCAYCSKCKNYVKNSRIMNHHTAPFATITCNNPRHKTLLRDVMEYDGSHCMDYDPIEPVYVEEEVIDVPGTYRTENVLLLKTNLNKELK